MKCRNEIRPGIIKLCPGWKIFGLVAGVWLTGFLQTGNLSTSFLCAKAALASEAPSRYTDCNSNGIDDLLELEGNDCNKNSYLDSCELEEGSSIDCNSNGYPDECDVKYNYFDCDNNGKIDFCETAEGTTADCNTNGLPDVCDVAMLDCNTNGQPDDCDIDSGTSMDCDTNGRPDECDVSTVGQVQKIRPSVNFDSDEFGHALDISGQFAVVGVPRSGRSGRAFVFRKIGQQWIEQQVLEPDLPDDDPANFGHSVAVFDDLIVVGAHNESYEDPVSGDPLENAGAVYVYRRTQGDGQETWELEDRLTPDIPYSSDYFGGAVDVVEDMIVIGSHLYGPSDHGAFFVFERVLEQWSQAEKVISPATVRSQFGSSVATDGQSVIVGAYRAKAGVPAETGAAYVYTVGDWQDVDILSADQVVANSHFGYVVDIEENVAVIGAPLLSGILEDPPQLYDGAAYVFTKQDQVWTQQTILKYIGDSSQRFGDAVTVSDGRILIGGWKIDYNGNTTSGMALIYETDDENWDLTGELHAEDANDGDYFGNAVALDQEDILIGARREDVIDESPHVIKTNEDDHGAVYYFRLPVTDCNENNSPDSCDLNDQVSSDCDANRIPDECTGGIVEAIDTKLFLSADRSCYLPGDIAVMNVLLQDATVDIVGGQFKLKYDETLVNHVLISVDSGSPFLELLYPRADSDNPVTPGDILCAVGVESGMQGATSGVMISFELEINSNAEVFCVQGDDLIWFETESSGSGGLVSDVETLLVDACERGYQVDNSDPQYSDMPLAVFGHSPVTISSEICGVFNTPEPGTGLKDADIDLDDFSRMEACLAGPQSSQTGECLAGYDGDSDLDVDLADYALFQNRFTGTCE